MSKALNDIADERRRQIDQEGWTPEHDDEYHSHGQLADAAAAYSIVAGAQARGASADDFTNEVINEFGWPWSDEFWKPKDARRNLVIAGALIAADIERLDRENGSHD